MASQIGLAQLVAYAYKGEGDRVGRRIHVAGGIASHSGHLRIQRWLVRDTQSD